mgnify:FL=1
MSRKRMSFKYMLSMSDEEDSGNYTTWRLRFMTSNHIIIRVYTDYLSSFVLKSTMKFSFVCTQLLKDSNYPQLLPICQMIMVTISSHLKQKLTMKHNFIIILWFSTLEQKTSNEVHISVVWFICTNYLILTWIKKTLVMGIRKCPEVQTWNLILK